MKKGNLVFATTNPDKIKEAEEILGLEIISEKIELDEIQSLDFVDVITHKAIQAYEKLGRPVLVEDSGIIFNCLGKLPGVFTKWFTKSIDLDNLVHLIDRYVDKTVVAVSYFGLYDGSNLKIGVGMLKGKIVPPRGKNGFGWDPIFIPDGSKETFAEMDGQTKNTLSMRKLALKDLFRQI